MTMQLGAWRRGLAAMWVAAGVAGPLEAQASAAPIFVLNSLDATVSVIDVAMKTVVRHIKVCRSRHGAWTLDHVARR